MKTKFILLLLGAATLFARPAQAQTTIKGNALYWMAGIVNVGCETRLGKLVTLESEAVYSPWKDLQGVRMQVLQLMPEVRVYPWGAFNKFYAGLYGGWHWFDMTKWNYINTGKFQKGHGWSLGLTLGFQVPFAQRWSMDAYASFGFQDSGYKGWDANKGQHYVGWNRSGEWLPYKLGVAFAYRLSK